MASVDLAFERVARETGIAPTYWRLWDQSEWLDPPGGSARDGEDGFLDETTGMRYRLARGRLDEFLDSDAVVFWGDFHHMATYLDQTADVLHRRMGLLPSRADARDLAADYLLLRGQSTRVMERSFTFGTTLAFNRTLDYSDEYGADFGRFIQNVRGAWFRDGYSARVAELYRSPGGASCFGSDAAFLTDGPTQSSTASGLGVFIGRSAIAPERVARLGRALAGFFDGAPRWIAWGTAPAMWPMRGRKRLRVAWPELENNGVTAGIRERAAHLRDVAWGSPLEDEVVPAAELFKRIADCEVILTDTYHLAVNAWRIGTPAVLLYESRSHPGWSVNSGDGIGRDKRLDLYSQLDALPLLLDIRALPTRARVRHLVDDVRQLRKPVAERATAIGDRGFGLVATSLIEEISR